MNNFILLVVAMFEHSKILSEDEAKKLSKEFQETTLPDNYESASRLIKQIYEKADIKAFEQRTSAK